MFFEPVPEEDFAQALSDTLAQWNSEEDWKGDERNVVLALARIWYSGSTGRIASKDVAAAWVLERLPVEHQAVLGEARAEYLSLKEEAVATRTEEVSAFVRYAKSAIEKKQGR